MRVEMVGAGLASALTLRATGATPAVASEVTGPGRDATALEMGNR
jgi:hypothetical protein